MICCHEYIPSIKYTSDTLYISYEAKNEGEDCAACICCYSFIHKIKGITSSNLTVKLYDRVIELSDEKYWTFPPTFVIVKGDTVNRKDKYGLKQGIWIDDDAIQKIEADTLAPKDYSLKRIHWAEQSVMFLRYTDERFFTSGRLYLNLKVRDEYNPKTGIRQEFYRNGMIKKECHDAEGGQQKCRQWERNGREIK